MHKALGWACSRMAAVIDSSEYFTMPLRLTALRPTVLLMTGLRLHNRLENFAQNTFEARALPKPAPIMENQGFQHLGIQIPKRENQVPPSMELESQGIENHVFLPNAPCATETRSSFKLTEATSAEELAEVRLASTIALPMRANSLRLRRGSAASVVSTCSHAWSSLHKLHVSLLVLQSHVYYPPSRSRAMLACVGSVELFYRRLAQNSPVVLPWIL